MNALTPISGGAARLPVSYENAKTALSECVQLDECQTWADKAAALASYAKQSKDEELMRMAVRIRDRAIRRAGELLQQIEPATGKNNQYAQVKGGDAPTVHSRKQAASDAGMSRDQMNTAIRVANVPTEEFEKAVEAEKPATVTKLAEMGTRSQPRPAAAPAPKPVLDLNGRDPTAFNQSLHFVAEFEDYSKTLQGFDLAAILPALSPAETDRVRAAISQIDAVHDRIITRI